MSLLNVQHPTCSYLDTSLSQGYPQWQIITANHLGEKTVFNNMDLHVQELKNVGE